MVRPFTFIFSTSTVDGRIASPVGYSLLSCREDFELQHEYRASVDAVMVGSKTAVIDKPRLTVRLSRGRSPLRVIVDSRLSTPPEVAGLRRGSILVTVEGHSRDRIAPYIDTGVEIVEAGRDRVDLALAVSILRERLGVRRLMVEGGGRLNCAMLREGLVDELRVTIAPFAFGGGVGLAECPGTFQGPPGSRVELALESTRTLCGSWLHLVYSVLSPKKPLY